MNKKQYLWLVAALAVFAVTGYLGVTSAADARERSAAAAEETTATLFSMLNGESGTDYDFPNEPFVARVDINGTIAESSTVSLDGGFNYTATMNYIDALIENDDNVGILLYVDSPGGEMKASDEIYLRLMDYKEFTGRPIWCYFDSTACSGGYYVAMAADDICANRNCVCVNIGVYIAGYNFTGLFEKLGVEQVLFKSSENKGIGISGVPWTDEQRAIYQAMVDESYEQFLDVVAAGRNMTPERVRELDDGREMTANQAMALGFVDSIGRYRDYESTVRSEAHTNTIYTAKPATPSFRDLLNQISSVLPRSDTQALIEFAEANSGYTVMAYAG